jgi:hypothetical protein
LTKTIFKLWKKVKIQKSPGTYASGYQSSLNQILVWSIKKSKIWSALATHTRIILTSMKPKHKKFLLDAMSPAHL